jgi:glycosyltransferase involved in cell wall biosynthesis
MRIGLISQWYDPEVGAVIPGTIARTLSSQGHQVEVLTGLPNYPTGRIYAGYRLRHYQREVLDGVTVHRAPLYASHDSHPGRRAANYLTFAAAASVVGLSALRHVDATLVYSAPATAALPALVLHRARRIPYVLLIQDIWPQSVTASGFLRDSSSRWVERGLQRFCDTVYRRAASIAVTSPGMADLVAARGIDERKIAVVPNCADETHFHPVERDPDLVRELGPFRPFTVMYAGNLGEVQGLDVLVEAADLLRSHRQVGFVLVGGGVAEQRLRRMVVERGLDNVRFVAPQPITRMAQVLALGDVQLVTLRDLPLFRSTLPSKLQATLAAGRPIIAAVRGDAAAVVAASGAGITVPPGSSAQLAAAILETSALSVQERRDLGDAGRRYYETHLSRRQGVARLSALVEQASRREPAPHRRQDPRLIKGWTE